MATKGRAGERLIPRAASSPRGLGRHLLSPSKRPSSSRELTQGGRSSRCPGHLGGGLCVVQQRVRGQSRGGGSRRLPEHVSRLLGSGPANARPPSRQPGAQRAGLDASVRWGTARPSGAQVVAPGGVGTSPCRLLVCRVPMGRQHGPPVPRWRQLLHAGCWWLLSLSGMTLWGLRWLWRLAWVSTTGPLPQGLGLGMGWGVLPGLPGCTGGLWFDVARAATTPSSSTTEGLGPSSLGVGSGHSMVLPTKSPGGVGTLLQALRSPGWL